MKKIVLALAAGLAFTAGAHAAPASASAAAQASAPAAAPSAADQATIRALMDSMNTRSSLQASLQQLSKSLPQMMRANAEMGLRNNPKLTPEQRQAELAKVEQQLPALSAALQKEFNDPKLVDEMYAEIVPLYSRHFTLDEMKAITEFYRTPAGKKALQAMPQLMMESMQIGQKLMQPRVQRVIEQFKQKK